MARGADIIAEVLAETGTHTLFSLSGNQIMPLYDACLEPGLRIIHTRHESSAVFMAEAYAQLSGSFGVALVTAAPGFANALGALYSARQSETPLILLTGDSPLSQDGRGAFQEFDQCEAARPFVKSTQRLTDISTFDALWRQCLQQAQSGTPGPVHLSLPFDVLNSPATKSISSDVLPSDVQSTPSVGDEDALSDKNLRRCLDFINLAERPLVLLGPAMCRSHLTELRSDLAEAMKAPFVKMESPRGVRDPVLGDFKTLCQRADRVLLLGKKPDFTTAFASQELFTETRFAAVLGGEENSLLVERNIGNRCDFHLNTSAELFTHAVRRFINSAGNQKPELSTPASRYEWNDLVRDCIERKPEIQLPSSGEALHPMQIATAVEKTITSPESVVICDGGEFGQWAQAGVRAGRRMINGPSGAIGGSLACAVGASTAAPESLVYVMLGDGTAGFYLAELETLARENVPAIVVIGNDSRWNAEYQIQLNEYGKERLHSCELPEGLRYEEVAKALGMAGEQVVTVEALETALERAVDRAKKERQATLLNVIMQGRKAPDYSD